VGTLRSALLVPIPATANRPCAGLRRQLQPDIALSGDFKGLVTLEGISIGTPALTPVLIQGQVGLVN
jgi:hypothetical protein